MALSKHTKKEARLHPLRPRHTLATQHEVYFVLSFNAARARARACAIYRHARTLTPYKYRTGECGIWSCPSTQPFEPSLTPALRLHRAAPRSFGGVARNFKHVPDLFECRFRPSTVHTYTHTDTLDIDIVLHTYTHTQSRRRNASISDTERVRFGIKCAPTPERSQALRCIDSSSDE